MNILVVVWSIQIGGAETFAVDLCLYLKRKGYTPYLFPVHSDWDNVYYNSIRSKDVTIASPFNNRAVNWFFWKLNALFLHLGFNSVRNSITQFYFKNFINRKNIDVIISNSSIADNFVGDNRKNKPVHIVVEHGEYSYSVIDEKEIITTGLHQANAIVSVSKWCQSIIKSKWNINSTIIYNGRLPSHDNDIRSTLKTNDITFCMAGRGIEYKGWLEGVCAFLDFKKIYPNSKLVLVGDGPYLKELKKEYENEESIKFIGRVTNPLTYIINSDVGLVLSRKYEAFGLVILDFFSVGKPIIATRVGAIAEVVNYENKPGGLLIDIDENGKAKQEQLVSSMILLASQKEKRNELGARAKEIANHFTFEKTGAGYEALIKKVTTSGV